MAEINLKDQFAIIARRIEEILRGQAPSSNLSGAVQVVYEDNNFIISLDDTAAYGIYLWRGTKNERAAGAVPGLDADALQTTYEAIWDKRPDSNPGKGEGGIKPRFWLNLRMADIDELQYEIEQAITNALEQQLETMSEV
jgi:hypothetical protein